MVVPRLSEPEPVQRALKIETTAPVWSALEDGARAEGMTLEEYVSDLIDVEMMVRAIVGGLDPECNPRDQIARGRVLKLLEHGDKVEKQPKK